MFTMKPRDVSLRLKHISILRDSGIHASSTARAGFPVSGSIELTPTANIASLILDRVSEEVYESTSKFLDQLFKSGVDPQASSSHQNDINEVRKRYPLVDKVAQVLWAKFRENKSIIDGLPKAFQPTLEDIRRSEGSALALALAPEIL
ncbi:MAG: hypothetical protein ACOYK1_03175 [Vampirovibrionia bacterium]